MAKAKKTLKVVKTFKLELELDENEAVSLYYILNNVGGSPDSSPRKYIDAIMGCLSENGFGGFTPINLFKKDNPALYFSDNSLELIDELVKEIKK